MKRIFFALFMLCTTSGAINVSNGFCSENIEITITGNIINANSIRIFVDDDTILQVVKLPKSGFSTEFDNKGRPYLPSNLASIIFPQNGPFEIKTKLKPGKYIICGQYFNSKRIAPILAKSEKKMASFLIKHNNDKHQKVNLGDVHFQNWYHEKL